MINQERIKNLLLELVQIDSHSRSRSRSTKPARQWAATRGT
jgi:hypothetical protein